jgi:hypothetical protein
MKSLLIAACILTGFLAGETVDRLVVGLPAWHHVDITAWAEYSRHADLGNGIFIYPFEAIGSCLLLMTCSVIILKNKSGLHRSSGMLHLSTLFALTGLILTFFAGPHMLSIRGQHDPLFLQHAFDQFYYWSTFRGIAQILSFITCTFALAWIPADK